MGVIDFSLYLRTPGLDTSPEETTEQADMTTVLDQKNYIEELNRHLKLVKVLDVLIEIFFFHCKYKSTMHL